MVAGNRGFVPIEAVTDVPQIGVTMKRVPLYRDEKQVRRSYYAFWKKDNGNPDIENFAEILRRMFVKNSLEQS